MDLLATLKKKVDALPEGDYVTGLRAVQRHIEAAFKHLQRGQDLPDESAYTDAIYRSNQAFEGSIKEAYRVLAGKLPDKIRPFDIENYLETEQVFRPRVLALFTNYRTEWRNPSTHDYKLDFDESEALLAIVSVTAFACLLADQIGEKLAFLASNENTVRQRKHLRLRLTKSGEPEPLVERVAYALLDFAKNQAKNSSSATQTESQVVGAVSGYLTAIASKGKVTVDDRLVEGSSKRADLAIREGDELVVIEMKLVRSPGSAMTSAIAQLEYYMLLSGTKAGILYLAGRPGSEYEMSTHYVPHDQGVIQIIGPAKAA
jgi:hypothetical protein